MPRKAKPKADPAPAPEPATTTKPSPKRLEAINKLKRVEDALLHVQATVGGYVAEVHEVREMLEPTDTEAKS